MTIGYSWVSFCNRQKVRCRACKRTVKWPEPCFVLSSGYENLPPTGEGCLAYLLWTQCPEKRTCCASPNRRLIALTEQLVETGASESVDNVLPSNACQCSVRIEWPSS